MKYKTGDILVGRLFGEERKVLGVCDDAVLIKNTTKVWDESEVDEEFALKPSEWKPEWGYYFIDSYGVVSESRWCGLDDDKFRLATKNCFRTREEAEARLSEIKKGAGLI